MITCKEKTKVVAQSTAMQLLKDGAMVILPGVRSVPDFESIAENRSFRGVKQPGTTIVY